MASVLEQLNIINGILFIPLSQKDLENLKAEVQRRQQLQESMKSGEQLEAEDKAVEEKEAEPSMPSAAIPLTQSSA